MGSIDRATLYSMVNSYFLAVQFWFILEVKDLKKKSLFI